MNARSFVSDGTRNALTKQYEKLLSFEKVKLKLPTGIVAVARKAFLQKPSHADCGQFSKK